MWKLRPDELVLSVNTNCLELFPPPPTLSFQDYVFANNYISIEFPMKQFSFKLILSVIV